MSSLPAGQLREEGLALFNQGAYDDALARFEAAATAYESAGDPAGQAEMLNNIGVVHRFRNNWQAAEDALRQSERAFAEAGDKIRQGQALGNLGDVYRVREPERAAAYYSDAAALFAEMGDGEKQSMVLRAMCLLSLRRRRVFEAMSLMEQSIAANPRSGIGQRLLLLLIRFMFNLQGRG